LNQRHTGMVASWKVPRSTNSPHSMFPTLRNSLIFLLGVVAGLPNSPAQDSAPLEPIPAIERRLPPEGLEIPAELRSRIDERLVEFEDDVWIVGSDELAPDVEIFAKAVRLALDHGEIYSAKELPLLDEMLDRGEERLRLLDEEDETPWADARGLVVRGYESSIDGSAQPCQKAAERHRQNGNPHHPDPGILGRIGVQPDSADFKAERGAKQHIPRDNSDDHSDKEAQRNGIQGGDCSGFQDCRGPCHNALIFPGAVRQKICNVDGDVVEHNGRDDLVRPRVCLQCAGNSGIQEARDRAAN